MQRVLDQRQRSRLVPRLIDHRLLDLADIEAGKPGRALDDLAQALGTDRCQRPWPCQPVAGGNQLRQVFEPIQKVCAHGGDNEQRAVGILQRRRKQTIEPATLLRIGEGEQLLKLIDG